MKHGHGLTDKKVQKQGGDINQQQLPIMRHDLMQQLKDYELKSGLTCLSLQYKGPKGLDAARVIVVAHKHYLKAISIRYNRGELYVDQGQLFLNKSSGVVRVICKQEFLLVECIRYNEESGTAGSGTAGSGIAGSTTRNPVGTSLGW